MAKQQRFISGGESAADQPHSAQTLALVGEILRRRQDEGLDVYTMEDFQHDYAKKYFPKLTPREKLEAIELLPLEERSQLLTSLISERQQEVLDSLPLEQRLEGLSEEQIREYLDKLTVKPHKPRRKK